MISSFTYTQDPTADEPIMFIDAEIGTGIDPDSGKPRIDGNEFKKELLTLDSMGKKRIKVFINSPGGVVFEGMAIFSAFQKAKAKIDTHCYGIAYSIAAIIFEGATGERTMDDWSSLMFHQPYQANTDEKDMTRSDKEMLAVVKNSCTLMIAEKTGKTAEEITKIMNRETYLTAEEAKESGFCDNIEVTQEIKNLTEGPQKWLKANKIYNRIKIENMANENEIICKKLKLNVNTSAEGIAEAVESILAKAKEEKDSHNVSMAKLKDQLDEATAKCDAIKKEMDELKEKNKKDIEDKVKADEETMDKKADEELKNAVTAGKIKDTAVPSFKEQFKKDFDGTKKILDAIAPSKIAAKFDTDNKDLTPFQKAWNTMKANDINNRLKVGDATYYNLKKQFNNK